MAIDNSNISPFSKASQRLAINGYSVIPIAPDSKAPSQYRAGRWYPMKRWEQYRDDPAKPFVLKLWSAWPEANIGIVTGTKATGTHIVAAVDYDTDDPDSLADLESALPQSPVRKRGRRGYTAFYLVPLRTKGFRTPAVELLTDTRQTVIPPSVHPDTGQAYVWLGEKTLLNTPAHKLPLLTKDDLKRFIEQVEALNKKPVKPTEVSPLFELPDNEQKFWRVLNNTAYANLDRWVPDLGMLKCERTHTDAYKAVAHWRPSSTGRLLSDRSPNLSIIPVYGAKDFGTGDSYTAIDLVMHALDISLDDAVKFLTSRLGIGTGWFEVPKIEFEQPADASSHAGEGSHGTGLIVAEPETGSTVNALPAVTTDAVPAKAEKHKLGEIPDALLHPDGLLGELIDWIVDGARRPSRVLALGPALGIVGTIAGRAVQGPTGSATHLYTIGLAPSGAGKDYPLQAISTILGAANLKNLIGPSEFISMPSVINFVQRQPLALCAMDEIGAWLKRLSNKNASTYEQSISKILRSLWGTSFKNYMTPEWAGRAAVEIENPALSLYGVSTPQEFFDGLKGADVQNGFLNRFLVFSTNRKVKDREPIHDGKVPDDLALKIHAIRNKVLQVSNADMASPIGRPRAPKQMVWNGGRRIWDALVSDLDKITDDPEIGPFFARTGEIAIRLATIHALGCGRMEVEEKDMQWGRDVAIWSAHNLATAAKGHIAENEFQGYYNTILAAIRAAPNGLSRTDVHRVVRGKLKAKAIDEVIDSLKEAGEIEEVKRVSAGGGRTAIIYRAI